MVDLMWLYIQTIERDYDIYMAKDDCNELLFLMETAGMLPPIEPDRTVYDLDLGVPDWEPEDEA